MRFAYQRRGGPLLDWSGPTPPSSTRAGETRSLGSLDVPRPGAPEVVGGYESPQPGAAIIHLGGYMPEGAARAYGQEMIGADAPASKALDPGLIRRAAVLAAAYHGVKRHNGSIMWGLLWAAAAFVTPVNGLLVPMLGVAQGFAQAKPKQNPASRRVIPAWIVIDKKTGKQKVTKRKPRMRKSERNRAKQRRMAAIRRKRAKR